jgi:oxygen-independent coproporphyrinogen III oxidase
MYDLATEQLSAAGLEQYEISNWSRAGFASRHNLQYWRNLPYVGLGPGAHGFAAGVRYATMLSPQRYIRSLQPEPGKYQFPRTPATDTAEIVNQQQEISETLMMGLRLTREGIDLDGFRGRFGSDLFDIHGRALRRFVEQRLIQISDNRVRLTSEGRLLSNIVFRELI